MRAYPIEISRWDVLRKISMRSAPYVFGALDSVWIRLRERTGVDAVIVQPLRDVTEPARVTAGGSGTRVHRVGRTWQTRARNSGEG